MGLGRPRRAEREARRAESRPQPGAMGRGPRPLPTPGQAGWSRQGASSDACLIQAPLSLLPSRLAVKLAERPFCAPCRGRWEGFFLGKKSVVERLPSSNATRPMEACCLGIPKGESVLGPSRASFVERVFLCEESPYMSSEGVCVGRGLGGLFFLQDLEEVRVCSRLQSGKPSLTRCCVLTWGLEGFAQSVS